MTSDRVITRVLKGTSIRKNRKPYVEHPIVRVSGREGGTESGIELNEKVLQRGILVAGGTGSGKTTFIKQCAKQLRRGILGDNYSMIVLEVKKDYQDDLACDGDLLLGQGKSRSASVFPNLFQDLLIDGWNEKDLELNCMELSKQLFADLKGQSQQFFPDAAQLLLYEVLLMYINDARSSLHARESLTNKGLVEFFSRFSEEDYKRLLENSKDPGVIKWLLGENGSNPQALGVIGQAVLTCLTTFVDIYGEEGDFSVRNFIRAKNNKCLFLQYDPAFKETQKRIFGVLLTQMFKEVLGQSATSGRVIFICDELPAIGKVDLSSLINMGRAKGLICIAGIQSISQLKDTFTAHEADSILAGFATKIFFRPYDDNDSGYIKNLFGKNLVEEIILSPGGNITERREGHVVEDDVIAGLQTGDCIVSLVEKVPYLAHLTRNGGKT